MGVYSVLREDRPRHKKSSRNARDGLHDLAGLDASDPMRAWTTATTLQAPPLERICFVGLVHDGLRLSGS